MEKQQENNVKIEEWRKWIEEIHKDITDLNDDKKCVDNLVGVKMKKDWYFCDFFNRACWAYFAMSIRREVDESKYQGVKPQSFVNLLSDISRHSNLISKEWFLDQWGNKKLGQDRLDDELNSFFDDEGKINYEIVDCDKEKLLSRTLEIKNTADKWIAHKDRDREKYSGATAKDIEKSLLFISGLAQKYNLLLNQDGSKPISTINHNRK